MKESEIQAKVLGDLKSFGKFAYVFKIIEANEPGIPDIFFCTSISGPIHIEMKQLGQKPKPHQDAKMDLADMVGCRSFVVDDISGWIALKKHLGINREALIEKGLCNDHSYRMAFTKAELARTASKS